MNTLSLLDRLFAWTWQNSLATVVLIALIWAFERASRRWLPPKWVYVLWFCVLLRLVIPTVPPSSLSIFNLRKEPTPPPIVLQAENPDTPDYTVANGLISEIPAASVPRWPRIIPYLWMAGALFYLVVVLAHHRKFYAWLKQQRAVTDPRLARLMSEAKELLNVRSEIQVIEANSTPSLFGVFKPHLLLPRAALENLNDADLRHVILHELVHLKRRDVSLNWLIIAVQALHWFNPFAWLAMRRLRSARELSCDAAVLTVLAPDDHKAYGATLIKILDHHSKISPTPSLVPILNPQNQIHRRITMIANFKPTTSLVTIACTVLVIGLGCLTFTRARERAPMVIEPLAAEPFQAAPGERAANREEPKSAVTAERNVGILNEMLERHDDMIRKKQQQLDAMKLELGISQFEETTGATLEAFRKLESARVEAQAEYEKLNNLYTHLAGLSRSEFKKVVGTATPDPHLATLQEQLTAAEQKLAALRENFSADHPEVRSVGKMIELIHKQVEERLEGILQGLKARTISMKAGVDRLQIEAEKLRKLDIDGSIRRGAYFQSKRELESLQKMRERLSERLMEEKINAALAK